LAFRRHPPVDEEGRLGCHMNKTRYGYLTAGFLAIAALCNAAAVAGLVDSTGPFLIQGKVVSGPGVTGWPVFVNERVTTLGASALISFRDGSRVLLERNSEVVLRNIAGHLTVKVTKGSISSKLGRGSDLALDVFKAGVDKVVPQPGSLKSLDELSPTDLSYFVTFQPRAQAYSAPIAITFTSVPAGVTTSPGPPPVSAYR